MHPTIAEVLLALSVPNKPYNSLLFATSISQAHMAALWYVVLVLL